MTWSKIQAPWRAVAADLNAVAGVALQGATFGLYQPEESTSTQRSGMSVQPIQTGAVDRRTGGVPQVAGTGQFGSGITQDAKLLKKRQQLEDEAYLQALAYAKINFLARAAQHEAT